MESNFKAEKMVGGKFVTKKKETSPNWVNGLLGTHFFDSCSSHQELKKNVFCIDCNLSLCRDCLNSHPFHRQLQICKYVYHDVVRLQDIHKHLDCSKIQTYKINGEKAVHLKSRPQPKDAKPSTKAKFGVACVTCGRFLQDTPNCFCSIECKVSEKPKEQNNDEIVAFSTEDISLSQEKRSSEDETSGLSVADTSEDNKGHNIRSELKPRGRLHKRKGIPHRAPFY